MIRLTERDAIFLTDAVQIEFLQAEGTSSLQECWKIPLSLQAYGTLLRLGFKRVMSYLDYIDFGECKRWYLDDGLRYAKDWLRELGLGFEVERIDIAELDTPCQFQLFSHLRFVETTAERIIAAMPDVESFYVVHARDRLELEFYFDSDVAAAVLCAVCERLGRSAQSIQMEKRPRYIHAQFNHRPITRAIPSSLNVKPHPTGIDRIGFAPATVANAEAIFESLRQVTPQTVIFQSMWAPGLSFGQEQVLPLSAADGDWSERVSGQLDDLYREFCRRRGRSTLPDAIVRNVHLDFQFEYIIRRRWLAYANMIHRGRRLVRDIPLKIFIHSDHFTAEGAVLSRLYRKNGTKILVSLHSNYPCNRNWASWDCGDWALVPSKSAARRVREISHVRKVFRTGDPESRKYRSLRKVRVAEQLLSLKESATGGRRVLLIITNALELNCFPFVDLKAHFAAMSTLAAIADQLKDRVAIVLRTKPGWVGEDPLLYEHLSNFFPDRLDIFERASFAESIQLADCIVGVNVATGGYYDILLRGAPLIHFESADVVSQQPDLPTEAILKITDPEALFHAIYGLLFDAQHRDKEIQRQRRFGEADFQPDYNQSDDPVRSVVQQVFEHRRFGSWWPLRTDSTRKPNTTAATQLKLSSLTLSDSRGAGSIDDIAYAPNGRGFVIGWAGDLCAEKPAKAVHLFVKGRWLAKGSPGMKRPDVAAVYGIHEFLATGFSVRFYLEDSGLVNELAVYAELQDDTFHRLPTSF